MVISQQVFIAYMVFLLLLTATTTLATTKVVINIIMGLFYVTMYVKVKANLVPMLK